MGSALPLGGQNPISLEYQIYPPAIDTLVTGMGGGVVPAAWQRVARAWHGGDIGPVPPLAAARFAWWAAVRALDRIAEAGPRRRRGRRRAAAPS